MPKRRKRNNNKVPAQEEHKVLSGVSSIDSFYWVVPCLAACVVYLPVLGFGFIFDDHTLIISNPQVHSWDYLPRLLSTHLWSHRREVSPMPQYRPLFSVWLLFMYTLAGSSTMLWHLTSIGLHVTATYLVFRFCFEVAESAFAASCAALLFAIHPIHVEPVSWVSSCNELLYTSFVLSSLFLFCRSLRCDGIDQSWKQPWKDLPWLSLVFWSAAIFTKESGLPILGVFFYLAHRAADRNLPWKNRVLQALRRATPYLVVVVFYFSLRLLFIHRVGLEAGQHSWREVLFSSPLIVGFYLKKLLLPIHLSGFYVNPLISVPTLQMWVALVIIVVVAGFLVWLSIKRSAAVGVASILLFFPMFPVLAGVRVFYQGDLAHDRYMYLPSAGLSLFVGLLAKWFLTAGKAAKLIGGSIGAIVLTSFMGLTLAQQSPYKSDESYFARGVKINPGNVLVRDYLGDYYLTHGQMDRALEQFNQAYDLDPSNLNARFCLARGLFANSEYGAAEPYLEQLSRSDQLPVGSKRIVLLALGQTEMKLNHFAHAEEVLNQLERENESYRGLHDSLGALYQAEGRIAEAQREYAREFEFSGDLLSRQKALSLAQAMRENPADQQPAPSQKSNSLILSQAPFQRPVD